MADWQRYPRAPARGVPYARPYAAQPAPAPRYKPPGGAYAARPNWRPLQPTQTPPPRDGVPARRPFPAQPGQVPPKPAARSRTLEDSFLFNLKEKRVSDVLHQYPKLYLSPEFTKLVAHWTESTLDFPLNVTIPFHIDHKLSLQVPSETDAEEASQGKHVARVMLLTYKPEGEAKQHYSKELKFLVAKKANGGLISIGGPWSSAIDGGNPHDDASLIKAAIRHTKDICGIDLSGCTKWIKFIELQYSRADGSADRTVIFLPNVWDHLTEGEVKVYKQVNKEEVDVEEEVEEEVVEADESKEGEQLVKKVKKKVMTKKVVETVVTRSMDLTLHGILEYDLQDKQEETAELSLFAEAFDEFLSIRNAKNILGTLKEKKEISDKQAAETKRKRDIEAAERAEKVAKEKEEREAKRRKIEEERRLEQERKQKEEEEEKNMTEEQIRERRAIEAEKKRKKEEEERLQREAEEKKKKEEEEQRKKAEAEEQARKEEEERNKKTKTVTTTSTHVDSGILDAFSYFDIQQSGQLKKEKIESVLFGLGSLSQREVDDLLVAVGLAKDRSTSLFYRTLATTTVTTTQEVPIEETKEEAAENAGETVSQ